MHFQNKLNLVVVPLEMENTDFEVDFICICKALTPVRSIIFSFINQFTKEEKHLLLDVQPLCLCQTVQQIRCWPDSFSKLWLYCSACLL